jgi:transcriptional regulator GlxA family with amidase domain
LRFGIFLFDGAEELDWAGPWEVLAAWAQQWPADEVEVVTISRDSGPVTCAKGLRVLSDHSWEDAPPLDVLIYPGGQGTRAHLTDDAVLDWLRSMDGILRTSVCTGSLVFAAAGLLRDRPATTHWSALEHLASLDNSVEVRPEERFVDSGDIVTAAGVSAGIDMALHLVRRLHSTQRARDVKRYIQYEPHSPV